MKNILKNGKAPLLLAEELLRKNNKRAVSIGIQYHINKRSHVGNINHAITIDITGAAVNTMLEKLYTVFKRVQSIKASSPIVVTLCGISIPVSPWHLKKALSPILVTLLLI